MNDLDNFLEEHELKLGEDYSIKPSKKYIVLREALKNYYQTYQSGWENDSKLSHFYTINNEEIKLNSAYGHNYIMNCYNAIITLQMFFEIYIVELLENIHPVLVKGKLNNEIDILNVINWEFETDFSSKKTISYSKILKRLQFIITHNDNLPENIRLKENFHFFSKHINTLKIVSELRNTMMHRGNGVLMDFALDVLWINNIIPLIIEIIKKEDDRLVFLDRNTHCGINVLQEFNKLKLPKDYKNFDNKQELIHKLNNICHLKELGRASFSNKKFMREFGGDEIENRLNEGSEGKRLSEINELAEYLRTKNEYYKKYECPCCGTKSLLNFEPWNMFELNKIQLHKAHCIQCTYYISIHIGEPKDFGIMSEKIFIDIHGPIYDDFFTKLIQNN